MVDSEFELTHCILFDLPEQLDQKQIARMIQKRLQKINLHGGSLTVNLPTDSVQFQLQQKPAGWRRWFTKLHHAVIPRKKDTASEIMQVKVSEDFVSQKWLPRLQLSQSLTRVELEGLSLPVLDEPSTADENKIFLQLGYRHCRVTLVKGKEILDHCNLDFSLLKLLPNKIALDPEKRKQALSLLQDAQLSYHNRHWQWQTSDTMEGMSDFLAYLDIQLQELARAFHRLLCDYQTRFSAAVAQIHIIGCGGLFPFFETFFVKKFSLPVTKAQPFSRMVKLGAGFNLSRLQQVEPLFAQAVALALSGAQSQSFANHDLSRRLSWQVPKVDWRAKRFRRFALGLSLLVLIFTLVTSLQLERTSQKYWTLKFKQQDLQQQLQSIQSSALFDSWLTGNQRQQFYETLVPRASQILRLVGEVIPTGVWITQIKILPESQVPEFNFNDKKVEPSGSVLIIEGKAASDNFVSEFLNRLNNTGHFSQLIIKRLDSRDDFAGSVAYSILAIIGNTYEEITVKN